jgi:hypothetical protein
MLISLGEHNWGDWMDAVHRELAADDAHGLTRLVDAYAGMGSFNDLVIHPVNGHRVEAERVNSVNIKLASLRSRMYEDASTLLHDLNS